MEINNCGSPELYSVIHFGEVRVFNLKAVFERFSKIRLIM